VIALGVLVAALGVPGAIIAVPTDQPDLAQAINAAQPLDTILLEPGVHTGAGFMNLVLSKPITIVGWGSTPFDAIVDCMNTTGSTFMTVTLDGGALLDNFTVRNCDGGTGAGGIHLNDSDAMLRNLYLTGNRGDLGGAIAVQASSPMPFPFLLNLILNNNGLDFPGGAIGVNGSNVEIRNCTIINNSSSGAVKLQGGARNITVGIASTILWDPIPQGPAVNLVDDLVHLHVIFSDVKGGVAGIGGSAAAVTEATSGTNFVSNLNVDPALDTQSFAPPSSSPLINAGDPLGHLDADFSIADIGAVPSYVETCGNRVTDRQEMCDDGNLVGGDGCSPTCTLEGVGGVCGDNIFNPPQEQCDDGNLMDNDGCNSMCFVEFCGDTITQPPREQCDDGNTFPGDGCNEICQLEFDAGLLPDASITLDAALPFDASMPPDAAFPFDASVQPDASVPRDASVPVDAAVPPDAALPPDASMPPDASPADAAEPPDAAVADASVVDAGLAPDAATEGEESLGGGGCLGCSSLNLGPLVLTGLVLRRRRRTA
jgi:cysteine-rich repeat protein